MSKVYNIEWSRRIVQLFCEKYARATTLFFLVYDFSEDDAAQLVSKEQRRWELFKAAVKHIDKSKRVKNEVVTKKDIRKLVEHAVLCLTSSAGGIQKIKEEEPTAD